MRLLLVATAIIVIVGASSLLAYWNRTIPMPFQSTYLVTLLTNELSRKGLWYQLSGGNSINVRARDKEKIFSIAKTIAENLTPPGRSLSASPSRQEAWEQALRVREIPYHSVCVDGIEWLVWENESDTGEVNQIMFNGSRANLSGENVNEPMFTSCP